jgi:hypothetical protein
MNKDHTIGVCAKIISNEINHLDADHEPLGSCPIFIIQRPYIEKYIEIFTRYNNLEKDFYVLHLSDEYCGDDISWYSLPFCKGIVRNYIREGLDEKKVLVIPLGYVKRTNKSLTHQIIQTPSLPFRELIWSFRGTGWQDRENKLKPLHGFGPNNCIFYKIWNDPELAKREEYVGEVLNSKFIPCPGGMNPETFRLYEALELGAIPLYVRQKGDDLYFKYLSNIIPTILNIDSWEYASKLLGHMINTPELMEQYRNTIMNEWILSKKNYSDAIKKMFANHIA